MAERMSIVFQLDPEAAAASGPQAHAHPLCGAVSVEYCATCSAAFAKIKAMVRCLEVCVRWRHGEALPAIRIDPWILAGYCRHPQLRALLRSEREPLDLSPAWAVTKRAGAEEAAIAAAAQAENEAKMEDALFRAQTTFDHVDQDGSGSLDAKEVGLLCADPALLSSFVPVGGRSRGHTLAPAEVEEQTAGLRELLDKKQGNLTWDAFEEWFIESAGGIQSAHREEQKTARAAATQAAIAVVEQLLARAEDWGVGEELKTALDALEKSRALLTAGAQHAAPPLRSALAHAQEVLSAITIRAARSAVVSKYLSEMATSLTDRVQAIQAALAFERTDGGGVAGAFAAMDPADVFMIAHRAAVVARIEVDTPHADHEPMRVVLREIAQLCGALEACTGWASQQPPPSRATHPALGDEGKEMPWSWDDHPRWFSPDSLMESALELLLLKQSKPESGKSKVQFTSRQAMHIETGTSDLLDSSMGSTVMRALFKKKKDDARQVREPAAKVCSSLSDAPRAALGHRTHPCGSETGQTEWRGLEPLPCNRPQLAVY